MVAEPRFPLVDMAPVHSFYQMYFTGFDAAARTFEPALKAFARCQLEVMGLASRRAQVYAEIPSRLSQCRTPYDLFNEQMRFWQTAFQQYSESTNRITAALSPLTMAMFPSASGEEKRERDYLSVPEPEQKDQAQQVRTRGSPERRVA